MSGKPSIPSGQTPSERTKTARYGKLSVRVGSLFFSMPATNVVTP